MSETNALLQKLGGVPTLTAGDQVLVNPLAATMVGNQAAQEVFKTRGLQAQQALGNILQQSTDPNGNVDYQKANSLAAAAGPVVQMGMRAAAESNSTLRGQQIAQAGAMNNLMAMHGMTLMKDPSDASVDAVFDNLAANGVPADVVARERARVLAMSPADRQSHAYQEGLAHLDQMRQVLGQTTQQQYGDVSRATTVTQPTPNQPGSTVVSGAPITHGPPAGSTTPSVEPFDEQGQIPRDARGVPIRTPKTWQTTTVPVTAVPGVTTGGQQSGGGPGPGPAPRSSAPSVTVPPPPAGNTSRPSAPPPGTGAGGGGGATQPTPPATQPPTGGAGGSGPPIVTAPPQGQPEQRTANMKAYTEDQAAVPAAVTQAQNTAHAYDALSLLKKLNSETGKNADTINAVRSRLSTLGLLPQGSVNIQTLQELFTKYTEKSMLDAAGGSSTNMGKEMAEKSSPGTLLGMQTNFEVLRNNLAKTLQTIAAQKSHEDPTGGGYLDYRAKVATTTDPRGFVWNMYDPEEQAKIKAEVKAAGATAVSRLNRAIGMSHILELHPPGATLAPPPGKGSFLMPPGIMAPPPAPGQNPLLMTG